MSRQTLRSLGTLHKLASRAVENKQRDIAVVNAQLDGIDSEIKRLNSDIDHQYQTAQKSADVQLLQLAASYQQRAEAEIETLHQARTLCEKDLQQKQNELRTLFLEQKRLETLIIQKQAAEKHAADKKNQQQLDENALNTFSRK